MQFLSISDPQIWLLAGISVLVVFSILVILVLILGIFTAIAKKTTEKAKAVKSTIETSLEAKTFEKASEEDKAAVAMALYLYFNEKDSPSFLIPLLGALSSTQDSNSIHNS